MVSTANNLRRYRQEALLRQSDLAARIDCTKACISNIERGARPGNWLTRKKLARALGVPESALFPDVLT